MDLDLDLDQDLDLDLDLGADLELDNNLLYIFIRHGQKVVMSEVL